MGRTRKPPTQEHRAPGVADDFQTPASALEPLLPYLRREWIIWEPACGEGNLVSGLVAADRTVIASDLKPGGDPKDFLNWQPPRWDASVTNPPFSIKDRWLARCYDLGKPFALLLPFTTLEGRVRQDLYRRYGVEVIILPKRVEFTTPSGLTGGAWFPVAWFTWGLGVGRDLTFWQPAAAEPAQGTLTLAGWR